MIHVVCENCGKLFDTYPCKLSEKNKLFCSRKCWYEYRTKSRTVKRICAVCNKEFTAFLSSVKEGRGICCSKSCASIYIAKNWRGDDFKETVTCQFCGTLFISNKSEKRKFCSHECYSKNKLGASFTTEWKEKISNSLKGKLPKNFGNGFGGVGENHPGFGKHRSEETKKKLSEYSGELASNWHGGVSFFPYCPKFNKKLKERIRERDNFTCQLCDRTEEENKRLYKHKLPVHHVHYDKDNCYPDLITLCSECNAKVNFNREYYEQLFMNKLNERGLLFWTKSIENCDEKTTPIINIHLSFYSLTPYQQRQRILKVIDKKYGLPKDIEEYLA